MVWEPFDFFWNPDKYPSDPTFPSGVCKEGAVCWHTHIPYHRILPGGRHIVNADSVGKPKDGKPQACYVVLETVDGKLSVTFRRVPYDVERAAQAIEASEMPNEYAEMLRTGTG